MADLAVFHVAIAPPEVLDTELITKVAAIINKDLYNTRLLLAGKIPKIITHSNSTERAEMVAQNLRILNLTALVFEDNELRRHIDCFCAYTADFGQGEIIFSSRSGQIIKMGTDSAFLILKGILSTRKETNITTAKTKLNVPLTVLTGGIPVIRTAKENIKEVISRDEYFLRFYDNKSAEPKVEILQNDFNYASLGSQKASSSQVNFNLLVGNITKVLPRAIFDDRLTKYTSADATSNTLNNIEINSRLIYSFYRARTQL